MSNDKYNNVSPGLLQSIQNAIKNVMADTSNNNDDDWDDDVRELNSYSSYLLSKSEKDELVAKIEEALELHKKKISIEKNETLLNSLAVTLLTLGISYNLVSCQQDNTKHIIEDIKLLFKDFPNINIASEQLIDVLIYLSDSLIINELLENNNYEYNDEYEDEFEPYM